MITCSLVFENSKIDKDIMHLLVPDSFDSKSSSLKLDQYHFMSNPFPSNDETTHITASLVPLKSQELIDPKEIEKLCLDILYSQLGEDTFGSFIDSKSSFLQDALPIFEPGHFNTLENISNLIENQNMSNKLVLTGNYLG